MSPLSVTLDDAVWHVVRFALQSYARGATGSISSRIADDADGRIRDALSTGGDRAPSVVADVGDVRVLVTPTGHGLLVSTRPAADPAAPWSVPVVATAADQVAYRLEPAGGAS